MREEKTNSRKTFAESDKLRAKLDKEHRQNSSLSPNSTMYIRGGQGQVRRQIDTQTNKSLSGPNAARRSPKKPSAPPRAANTRNVKKIGPR